MGEGVSVPASDPRSTRTSLAELAALFLRLGATSFGGPAAHIAMMEAEVVRRRGWLTREEFLDLVGATNLIPGPNSTELAIHIGLARAGFAGLLVAGASFILPAVIIVWLLARAYVAYGSMPAATAILAAVKPVVVVVVAQAIWSLGRTAVRTLPLAMIGVVCTLSYLFGVSELVVLALGAALALAQRAAPEARGAFFGMPIGATAATAASAGAIAGGAPTLWPLFLSFVKIGSVLFGSGYVLIAFLRAEFVDRLHWITNAQLFDAIAVGQVTPGPVFTTATFVGYLAAGSRGAMVATLGIFLPAFVFVAISGPLLPRLRKSTVFRALLDGVNVGSLGLMLVVTAQLARESMLSATSWGIGVAAAGLILRLKVNASWVLLGATVLGLLLSLR